MCLSLVDVREIGVAARSKLQVDFDIAFVDGYH